MTRTKTRALANWPNNAVSVLDYGAMGDGVTDDTAAIQAAVDANPYSLILLPAGTYRITSSITNALTATSSVSGFIGSGSSVSIIDNQSDGPAFLYDGGPGATFAYNVKFSDLTIDSTTGSANSSGVKLDACRLVTISDCFIRNQGSHGIWGTSTIGDFTDTAQVKIIQTELRNNGGYGIYASSRSGGIQYQWNLEQSGVYQNGLGGALYESHTSLEINACGFAYNREFGLKINRFDGSQNASKIVSIKQCEFDMNENTQIILEDTYNVFIYQPYLIFGQLGPDYAPSLVGIQYEGSSSLNVIGASPRIGAGSGYTLVKLIGDGLPVFVNYTDYSGWVSSGNTLWEDPNDRIVVEDSYNVQAQVKGTYEAAIGSTDNAGWSSSTKVTANYLIDGKQALINFRNYDNIDTSGAGASAILTLNSIPGTTVSIGDSVGFMGNSIVTGQSAVVYPIISNGGSKFAFLKSDGSYLTEGDVTSGSWSIKQFTINFTIQ